MLVIIVSGAFLVLVAGMGLVRWFKANYLKYNLLRADPLESYKLSGAVTSAPSLADGVWFLGDSRISHWNMNLFSPPAKLLNLGLDGQTSGQVLGRFRNYLATAHPRAIVFQAGINDVKIVGVNRQLRERIASACFENLAEILRLCRQSGIPAVAMPILLTGQIELPRRIIWNPDADDALREINEKLAHFCAAQQFSLFDANRVLADDQDHIRARFRNGFLHLNTAGYEALTVALNREYGSLWTARKTP